MSEGIHRLSYYVQIPVKESETTDKCSYSINAVNGTNLFLLVVDNKCMESETSKEV